MSWGAQNRSKDAKTPSQSPAMSRNPKPELCGIQPYHSYIKLLSPVLIVFLSQSRCRLAYMHRQRTYGQLANVQLVMCAFRLIRFG
jgi:hypothetical protein